MAYFTKDWYEKMQDAHVLALPESDEEWADYIRSFEENGEDIQAYLRNSLEQIKEQLLNVLPKEFHSHIDDGSINQPYLSKKVKMRLLTWLKGKQQECEGVLMQASVHFESIRDQLPEGFVTLKEDGLHDACILHVIRNDDTIRITLDGAGSFNNANRIVLIFQKVKEDHGELPLQGGQYWLYEEVDVHEAGAVFRVLVDGPITQWTVTAEDVTIEHYYKANSLPVWQDEGQTLGASGRRDSDGGRKIAGEVSGGIQGVTCRTERGSPNTRPDCDSRGSCGCGPVIWCRSACSKRRVCLD